MSSYQRNNTMVACIIAFIIVGGTAIGAAFLLSSVNMFNWYDSHDWSHGTLFEFERGDLPIPDEILVDISVSVGSVQVSYLNDPDLTYSISIWVPNRTLNQYGDPNVTWDSSRIAVNYPVCRLNITLGLNATYSYLVAVTTGTISITMDNQARVGNIDATTSTGTIDVTMTDDVVIEGNLTFDLITGAGTIDLAIDLPVGTGGRFSGTATTGTVNVNPVGWSAIDDNIYETSNYSAASDTVTITAASSTGTITATLS